MITFPFARDRILHYTTVPRKLYSAFIQDGLNLIIQYLFSAWPGGVGEQDIAFRVYYDVVGDQVHALGTYFVFNWFPYT
jgi:hypothetical protein